MTVSISGPGEPITLDIAAPLAPTRMATTRRYLMCPPTYFTVEYAINPWMDPTQPTSTSLAVEQWTALKETYERLGHEVHVIEPQPGLPDMVFSANSGTVIDGRVLGSRFRAEQRSAEADHFRRWFLGAGYKSVVMPTAVNEAEAVLRRLFPDAVIANDDDAVCLGLNAVSDGKHVVMPVEAVHLAEQVARRGFEPVFVDISELRKSGGGPKCCTMELRG